MAAALIERLAAHRTIAAVPRDELSWLAAHGRIRTYAAGDIVTPDEGPVEGLYLVLSGQLSIHVDRGTGPRKVMEWLAGDVTGLLPYSRLTAPPGDVVAEQPSELLLVARDDLPAMIRSCPELTATLVHVMVDRARHFTSAALQDEKMLSLGRLAAGLAHELNNPASALVRSAAALGPRLDGMEATSRALGASLSPDQLAGVDRAIAACARTPVNAVRSPLEQSDHEDALAGWLEARGIDPALADPLAEASIETASLDRLAAALDAPALEIALRGLAAGCTARAIVSEIEIAATRIHTLVAAIKRFTYMDRDGALAPVDIAQGLRDTLAVLQGKARSKSARVTLTIAGDLPAVEGYGGELNQVWANLIDNALDAVPSGGSVDVHAAPEGRAIVVRVVDDGPGVPDAIRGRIFDPFFTTKEVGRGTGLGLDLARRLVARHRGDITLESRPGRTEFRVTLPGRTGA